MLLSLATRRVVAAVVNPGEPDRPGCSDGGRCGGSACARTGSTCGSGRSSCSRGHRRSGFSLPRPRSDRRHVRDREPIVAVRRGADPPGRARSGLGSSSARGARSGARAIDARRRTSCSRGAAAGALLLVGDSLGGVLPAASAGIGASRRCRRRDKAAGAAADEPDRPPIRKARRDAAGGHEDRVPRRSSTSATRPPKARSRPTTSRIRGCACRPSWPTSASAGRYPEISGARSIVETFEGQPNAATVAQDHVSAGYHGCWILALGTNDVDNVHTARRSGCRRGSPA